MRLYPLLSKKRFDYLLDHNIDAFPTTVIDGNQAIMLYRAAVVNKILKPLTDKMGSPIHSIGDKSLYQEALDSVGMVMDEEEHEMTSTSGMKVMGHYYYFK